MARVFRGVFNDNYSFTFDPKEGLWVLLCATTGDTIQVFPDNKDDVEGFLDLIRTIDTEGVLSS